MKQNLENISKQNEELNKEITNLRQGKNIQIKDLKEKVNELVQVIINLKNYFIMYY